MTTPTSEEPVPPPATGPSAPTAAGAPAVPRLTRREARVLAGRDLAESHGRAFTRRKRAGFALRCTSRGERRARCRVSWRSKGWRYAGTVTITRRGARDATVVSVARRRAG